jgi:hypothetical protein
MLTQIKIKYHHQQTITIHRRKVNHRKKQQKGDTIDLVHIGK